MITASKFDTVQILNQIGDFILVADAWKHTFDNRRLTFELCRLAQIVVHTHNAGSPPEDAIAFDDDEAVWVVNLLSVLKDQRPKPE